MDIYCGWISVHFIGHLAKKDEGREEMTPKTIQKNTTKDRMKRIEKSAPKKLQETKKHHISQELFILQRSPWMTITSAGPHHPHPKKNSTASAHFLERATAPHLTHPNY